MSHYPCLNKQYIQEVLSPYQVKLQKNWKDHLNSEILDKYIEIKRKQKQKLSEILPRYTIFPKCYDQYNIYTVNYDLDRLERIRNANNAKYTNLKLSKPKNSNIQQNDDVMFAKSNSQIISCPKRIQRQQDNRSDNKIKRKSNNLYERDVQSHIKFCQSKSTKSLTQTGVSPSKLSKKVDKKAFKNGTQSDSQLSIEHFRRQNYKRQTDNKSWTSNLRPNTNKQRQNQIKGNFQNVQSALTVVRQKPKYQYESNEDYYYRNDEAKNRQIKNSKQPKRVNLVNDKTEKNYSAFPQRRPYQRKMFKQGLNSKRTIRGAAEQHQQRRKQNYYVAAGKTIYFHRKQNDQLSDQNNHQYEKIRKSNKQSEQSQLSRLNNDKKTSNKCLEKQKNYYPSQSESRASCEYDQPQSMQSKLQKRIQNKFNVKFKTSSEKRNNQIQKQKQKYPTKQQKYQAQLEKTNTKQRENHFTDQKVRREEQKIIEKANDKQIYKIRQNKDELQKGKSIETKYHSNQYDSLGQQTSKMNKLNKRQDQQFQNKKDQKSELSNNLEEEKRRDNRQKPKQQKDNNQNSQQSVQKVLSSQKQMEQRQEKKHSIITFSKGQNSESNSAIGKANGQNKQFSNLSLPKHQYGDSMKGNNEENFEKRAKFRKKTQSQSTKQNKLEDQSENKNRNKLQIQGQRKQQNSMKHLKGENSKKQLSQIEQETNQMKLSKDLDDNSAKMSALQSKFSQHYGQEFQRIKAERDYLRKHFILHLQNKHSEALPYKQLTSITIDSSGKKLILTSQPIPHTDNTAINTFQAQMT